MKKVLCIFIVITSFLSCTACKDESASPIPIEHMKKQDGSYGWGTLTWGMDIDTVESTLGYALSENANEGFNMEDETDYRNDPYTGTAMFMEKVPVSIFGVSGTVSYTFQDGFLKDVFLPFYGEEHPQEKLKAAYEQLYAELVSQYGEPDEIRDTDALGLFSMAAHWNGSEVNGKMTGLNCSILYTDRDKKEIHSITLAVSTYGG